MNVLDPYLDASKVHKSLLLYFHGLGYCHAPGFTTRLVRGLGELIRFKLLIILRKSFIKSC